jgi:hypothetical protein
VLLARARRRWPPHRTSVKAKVLDLSLYVSLALKLVINDFGCAVWPSYTCT